MIESWGQFHKHQNNLSRALFLLFVWRKICCNQGKCPGAPLGTALTSQTPPLSYQFLVNIEKNKTLFTPPHRCFQIIEESDQHLLLERNTPLFVQLHLARCLTGPGHLMGQFTPQDSSQDQLPQFKKQWLKSYRQNWQLENFNARVQLFRPGVDLDDFGSLFSNLKFLNRASSLEQVRVHS